MREAEAHPRGMVSRRRVVAMVLLGGAGALLAACQAAPSVTGSATSAPAPASNQAPAAGAAGQASGDWEATYNSWQNGAKSEGTVVVLGPPTPLLKTTLPQAFKARFGVDMQYSGEAPTTAAPRLASERAGGVYSTDVVIAGAGSMFQQIAGAGAMNGDAMGMLSPLKPQLILPDAIDTSKYRDGKLWFADPQGSYAYRMTNFTNHAISVNTDHVKVADITVWNDLLKPEYTGKIASYDPTVNGAAAGDTVYLDGKLGRDYMKRLFVDQKTFVVRDAQQLANALAQGTYPIAIFLEEQALSDLIKQGLHVDRVPQPRDTLPTNTGGFGFLGLLDHAPHPNAAKLFANWILSKEGQQVFQNAQLQPSRRNDLDSSSYPAWFTAIIPVPGQEYFDIHGWDFVLKTQPGVQKQLQSLIRGT